MRLVLHLLLINTLLLLVIPSKISAKISITKIRTSNLLYDNICYKANYRNNFVAKINISNKDSDQVRKLNTEYVSKMMHNKRLFPFGKRRVIAYAGMEYDSHGNPEVKSMIYRLKELGVNCYCYLVEPHSKQDFQLLPKFCSLAAKNRIEVWVLLVPPSEEPGSPSIKDDKLRYPPYGLNYIEWAKNIAAISRKHPNLTLLLIDDFAYNLNLFTSMYTEKIYKALKEENKNFLLGATIYEEEINSKKFNFNPYKPFFDAVVWGYQDHAKEFPNYAISASSLPYQIADFRKAFHNTLLVPCLYFTPHSSWKRKPTKSYLKNALATAYQEAGNVFIFRTPPSSSMRQDIVKNFCKKHHLLITK